MCSGETVVSRIISVIRNFVPVMFARFLSVNLIMNVSLQKKSTKPSPVNASPRKIRLRNNEKNINKFLFLTKMCLRLTFLLYQVGLDTYTQLGQCKSNKRLDLTLFPASEMYDQATHR